MSQAAAQRLEEEVKLLRKMQDEAQQTMNTRAQLVAQMKENELVKQELDLIADDDEGARIYKLIGPVLVKQEKKEAASNVGKRIDFLQVAPPARDGKLRDFLIIFIFFSNRRASCRSSSPTLRRCRKSRRPSAGSSSRCRPSCSSPSSPPPKLQ